MRSASSGLRPSIACFAVLGIVACAYSRSIDAPFVWDDRPLILNEPAIHEVKAVDYFFNPFWRETPEGGAGARYYRPVTTLTFAIDWQLWSGSPAGFHLTNLALHLAVTALVFSLARRMGATVHGAAIGAALFGVFPRLTESTSWISGRTDLLAATFALGALLVHSSEERAHARRFAAAALLLIALFSKEVAIAALAALVILEWRSGRSARELARKWPVLAPYVLSLLVYAAFRTYVLGSVTIPDAQQAYPPDAGRWLLPLEAVGRYAAMLADPLHPAILNGSLANPSRRYALAGAISIVAGLTLAARRSGKRPDPHVLAAVALAFFAIAPVLHVVPLELAAVACDRFLYLPVAGLAMAVAVCATRASPRSRKVMAAAALAAVPLFAGATYLRTLDWADEVRLWDVARADAKHRSAVAATEYAHALRRAGRLEEALPLLDDVAARTTGSTRRAALSNAALTLADLGRLEEAAARLRAIISDEHGTAVDHYNLGLVEAKRLRFGIALSELATAIELFPRYEEAIRARGVISAAGAEWQTIPADDHRARFQAQRASILARLGATSNAADLWRLVVEAADADQRDVETAAAFFIRNGMERDARRAVATAVTRRTTGAATLSAALRARFGDG